MKIVYEFSAINTRKVDIKLQCLFFDKWRYKILWQLRDLEEEMEKENGIIVIPALDRKLFNIEVRGFSDKLADEICKRLSSFCKQSLLLDNK